MTIFAPLPGSHTGLERGLAIRSQVRTEENSCRSLRMSRPTPMTITEIAPFVVRVNIEGVVSVRLAA
jgi:hypothetical protein